MTVTKKMHTEDQHRKSKQNMVSPIFHMSKIALYIHFLAYNKINFPQKTEKASGT